MTRKSRERENTFSIHHSITKLDFIAMYYRGDVDILQTYENNP
jgi:hypothetical protein